MSAGDLARRISGLSQSLHDPHLQCLIQGATGQGLQLPGIVGLNKLLGLLPGGSGGLFDLLHSRLGNVLVIYAERESGMHDASQSQPGHAIQKFAGHSGTVLLNYAVGYLALEGPHRLGIYGALKKLSVLYDHKSIVFAVGAPAYVAVVAEVGLKGEVEAPGQDQAEYLFSGPVGLVVNEAGRFGQLWYVELL